MAGPQAQPVHRAAPPRLWVGVLLLLATSSLWSLNGPLIKLLNAGGDGLPGISIACFRSLIAGALFLPLAIPWRQTLRRVRPVWPIASILTFTMMTACFVIATTQTASANAIVLQYTSPLWVFALSPLLLRERARANEGLVLLLAMVGVAVIFLGGWTTDLPGLTIALASGLGYGALTVILRGLRNVAPTVVVTLNCLGSGLLLLPAAAVWGSFELSGRQLVLIAVISVVQFALPYMLFSWALRYIEAQRASLITLLETILNPIFTYIAVGERVPVATLAGGPLILASVAGWILLTWRNRRAAAENPPAPSAPAARDVAGSAQQAGGSSLSM